MNFLKWYKNKVESGNLEPPETVWENVQDQLDIDYSWQQINAHLEQKTGVKRQFWYAAAAGLLIFIMAGGGYWWFSSDNLTLKQQIAEKTTIVNDGVDDETLEKTEDQKSGNDPVIKHEIITDEKITEPGPIKQSENLVAENTSDLLKKDQESVITADEILFDENNALIAELTSLDYKMKDISVGREIVLPVTENIHHDEKPDQERVAFQKFYTGTTGQLANTWLLNEKTYSGLESTSLTASNASFGSNFGIFAGVNITEKLFLQFDLNILAQNKQDYNEYLEGQYISNEMKFNYSQLGFSLRYIAFSNRYMKGEHNIYGGGYWGYLHSAYQVIDSEPYNITDYYAKSDYGVFLGYEYIFPLTKNLGFGTGVKAMYGLNNIYSGDHYIPSYLNKTHNASLNITFSLKYNLK
ncbi:MAG: hypothetical protein ACQERU_11925 [Bacteroidota bacterium]